jgi:serine/threonine protein kinase
MSNLQDINISQIDSESSFSRPPSPSLNQICQVATMNTIDQFVFIKTLGTGRGGSVTEVTHKSTKAVYAIKNRKMDDRIMMEIQMSKNFSHVNMGTICNYFWYLDKVYTVMPKHGSCDLIEYINSHRIPLSETVIARILLDVCNALNYLQEFNVVHADVKPENIIISTQPTLKATLIDFECSLQFPKGVRQKRVRRRIGTHGYMSPEVYEERLMTDRSDVWGLGVVFFAMLYGKMLVSEGSNPKDVKIHNHYEWCRRRGRSMESWDLMRKMLHVDFGNRIPFCEIVQHSFFHTLH